MIALFDFCKEREVVYQILYGLLSAISMIGPGMSMGYSAVALPSLANGTSGLIVADDGATWFASLTVIATPFGCVVSLFTMKSGRRAAIATAGIVCTLGWILVASSFSIPQLLVGRFVTGFSTGLAATPGTVYLAEISTPRLTTFLTSCTSLFINVGILLIYFLGSVTDRDWRIVAAIATLPSLVSVVGTLLCLPESPRWLLDRGRAEEARTSLLRVRGLAVETECFEKEFAEMLRYSEQQRSESTTDAASVTTTTTTTTAKRSTLLDGASEKLKFVVECAKIPEIWKPLVILNAFFFFQQFCGLYVVIAYAVDLVAMAGVTVDAYVAAVAIGLVQLLGTVSSVGCSTRIGRRTAAVVSGVGMSISLAVLGVYNQFFRNNSLSGIPLGCVLFFVGTGSFGFNVLPWAMIGELYPTKFVNVLGSLTACLAYIYNFATVQLYPTLVSFDEIATIYLYCAISVAGTIFVALVLPETMGKSKIEIEEQFREGSYKNDRM